MDDPIECIKLGMAWEWKVSKEVKLRGLISYWKGKKRPSLKILKPNARLLPKKKVPRKLDLLNLMKRKNGPKKIDRLVVNPPEIKYDAEDKALYILFALILIIMSVWILNSFEIIQNGPDERCNSK